MWVCWHGLVLVRRPSSADWGGVQQTTRFRHGGLSLWGHHVAYVSTYMFYWRKGMNSYSYFHQSEIHPDRIWGHTRSNILQPYALNGVKKWPQKVTVAPPGRWSPWRPPGCHCLPISWPQRWPLGFSGKFGKTKWSQTKYWRAILFILLFQIYIHRMWGVADWSLDNIIRPHLRLNDVKSEKNYQTIATRKQN